MKTHARVVVIGGGAVGASIQYHLTKAGISDVVLLERDALTAGSTWHAAGLLPLFNMSYAVGQIHKYSVDLYKTLEEETGQHVSFHQVGNLRLAGSKDRMDEYQAYASTARTIGVDVEFLTPNDVKNLWPLCMTDDLVGAIFHPQDGHVAPADLTQAFAAGAKMRGGTIYQGTEYDVKSLQKNASGDWEVTTEAGTITCEIVVTATGNHARRTAAMVGLDIPAIPVEHQFIVTDVIEELVERHKQGLPELPVLRDSDNSWYLREERQGLILGPYEHGAPAWGVDGVPKGFGKELLPPDLERLMPHVESAIARVPCFETGGVKDIVNGPISYTPDGNPLIGPAPGLDNFYFAEGFSFGITAAGGAGKVLADMIVEGEASFDTLAIDPRRFGDWCTKTYTKEKNEECYEHVFVVHYPDEERSACRPFRTTPCYDRLKARGAVFGQKYGWERANWFATDGVEQKDVWSFRRTNYFPCVAHEAKIMQDAVGLIDMSSFSKTLVSGPKANEWLDGFVANRLPAEGRVGLCHHLTESGGVASEYTILRTGEHSFYMVSAGAQETYDRDLLMRSLPDFGPKGSGESSGVDVRDVTTSHGVFVLSGPNARTLMERLTDADMSNEAFPWLSGQRLLMGMAPVWALRVNFVGELGWEIHHPIEMQNYLFDLIDKTGADLGLGMVGMRAMFSMALEKSYRNIGKELSTEVTAYESGLGRFVRLKKTSDFRGKDALRHQKENGQNWHFVTLEVDANDADSLGSEAIFSGGEIVGRATTGGYGHRIGKSLALGFVREKECAASGTDLKINMLGDYRSAKVVDESPYDPENKRLMS